MDRQSPSKTRANPGSERARQWCKWLEDSSHLLSLLFIISFLETIIIPIPIELVLIPFQVAMIAAGLAGYPISLFVTAALMARGVRYFGLGWLAYRFGERAKELWDKHSLIASLGGGAIIMAIYLLSQFLAGKIV